MKSHIKISGTDHLYAILILTSVAFLIAVISILVFNLLVDKSYSLFIFRFIAVYDFAVSSTIIFILLLKLFHWIKRKRNFYEFLYLAAFSMFLFTLLTAALNTIQELNGRPLTITPFPDPWDNFTSKVDFDLYRYSFLISFGLFWIATSFLLRNYYTTNYLKKFGKWKYWILVILPMIYYITAVDYISNPIQNQLYSKYPDFTDVLMILWGISRQVGGFFFALTFLFMSRGVDNTNLKYYLQITAIGIMMLFSSIQIKTLLLLPYPPFGLITLSILPISSLFVLIGLLSSARLLSYDKKFLLELRRYINQESNSFLNAIGSAEWNKNLEVSVRGVLKHLKKEDDEIDYTLEENDIKSYVLDVIQELNKQKTPK
jgi:hypothetical protein